MNIVTQRADSRYVIIIGIVVEVFVSENNESFIILSCLKSIRLAFLKAVVLSITIKSIGGIDTENTSFGIRADK
jgi:hypothetical protein